MSYNAGMRRRGENARAPPAETYLCASQSRVSQRTPRGLAADVCEVSGEC